MQTLNLFKIGGGILNDATTLNAFLSEVSQFNGKKVLVHGGGRGADILLNRLGIKPLMVEGRRVTDAETLDVLIMYYAGMINRTLVSRLQRYGCNALGLSGADANTITATKRPVKSIDYGWVGDLNASSVQIHTINGLLELGLTPVFCPIMHDGKGQLLNTNADTVAATLAVALSKLYKVRLHYCFDKLGVLNDVNDPESLISEINPSQYKEYISKGLVSDGMVPKLDNAFLSLEQGVSEVILEHALYINKSQKTIIHN